MKTVVFQVMLACLMAVLISPLWADTESLPLADEPAVAVPQPVPAPQPVATPKERLAVVVTSQSWGSWGRPWEDVAETLQDLLINSSRFEVVERQRLREVVREIDYGRSEYFDPATCARVGRLTGARFILFVSVSNYQLNDWTSVQYRNWGNSGQVRLSKAQVGLKARLVEVERGIGVWASPAKGYVGSEIGQRWQGGVGAWNRSIYLRWANSPTGQASQKAATNLVNDLCRWQMPAPATTDSAAIGSGEVGIINVDPGLSVPRAGQILGIYDPTGKAVTTKVIVLKVFGRQAETKVIWGPSPQGNHITWCVLAN